MKKRWLTWLILLPLASHAQEDEVIKKMQRKLDDFNEHYQPEYVHVVADKDIYYSGEKLWYALYLFNDPYAVNSLSTIAYVELRDSLNTILMRQKVRCREGKGHGDLRLPQKLLTGCYKIVAFTAWMRNRGDSHFEKIVSVINLDERLPSAANEITSATSSPMKVIRTEPTKLGVTPSRSGDVIAYNREVVFFHRRAAAGEKVTIDINAKGNTEVYLQLLDETGKSADGLKVTTMNIEADLTITPARKQFQPGSDIELILDLKDKLGIPVDATLSAVVRPKSLVQRMEAEIQGAASPPLVSTSLDTLPIKKEMFVHPPSKGTLDPISFNGKSMTPYALRLTDADRDALKGSELKKRVMTRYQVDPLYKEEPDYNFRSNNTYEPRKYSLPSLEEFIREIVASVKVRKVKGSKVLRVRNSDNPTSVYFFDGDPLLVADGYVVASAEFLSIPIADVERLDVLWGTNEINSIGVFSLADNGLVSLTTKSRSGFTKGKSELFKGLYSPLKFEIPVSKDKENSIPLLLDPVYWNPAVRVRGRTRLVFTATDELGEFEVMVTGVTRDGSLVTGSATFKVALAPD